MTIYELSEELHISEWLVQRSIKIMEERGLVKESTWRGGKSGKQKVWVLLAGPGDPAKPVVKVQWPSGEARAAIIVANALRHDQHFRDVSGAMAQAYRYSHYVNAPFPDSAKAGSTTPLQCKATVREALDFTRKLVQTLEALLIAPLWETSLEGPSLGE